MLFAPCLTLCGKKIKNKNKCNFIACLYFLFVPAALYNLQTYIKSAVSAVMKVAYGKTVYGGAEELLQFCILVTLQCPYFVLKTSLFVRL